MCESHLRRVTAQSRTSAGHATEAIGIRVAVAAAAAAARMREEVEVHVGVAEGQVSPDRGCRQAGRAQRLWSML